MARNDELPSRGDATCPYGFKKNEVDLRLHEINVDRSNVGGGTEFHASTHGGRSPVDSTEEFLAVDPGSGQDRADDDRVSGTGSEEMIFSSRKGPTEAKIFEE